MAKVKGNLYVIQHKSTLGIKSKTIVHSPDAKGANKVAKELFPRSSDTWKIKRYKAKSGTIIKQTWDDKKAGGGTHESTESMVHSGDDEPFEEEGTINKTFTSNQQEDEDLPD